MTILYNAEMQSALLNIEDNSIDSIITDPPYGINFMAKKWDYDVPTTYMWKQCLRVLKPGGHLLSFSSARTYHRMVVAVEDAGFEVRDQIMWCYNSGFPKSHNIGKKVDGFKGWGTQIKPAHEPIAVCRKPLSESTVASNVVRWGTGGLNIDQSRVPFQDGEEVVYHSVGEVGNFAGRVGKETVSDKDYHSRTDGRWPANLIHDGLWDDKDHGKFYFVPKVSKRERNEGLDHFAEGLYSNDGRHTTNDTAYQRGYAVGKNTHPTVKPIALMHYLIRMTTPSGGTTLDPFMGSGSTGCAAVSNGYNFIGIEMDKQSYNVAEARIDYWKA